MESKKTFRLLTLIFSLLMIENSLASQIPPDNDHSRIGVDGSTPKMDGSWDGNSSDRGELLVPPPATKTTISVSTAVSPTSATMKTSVSSSSNTSSTSVTRGGTSSKSSSTRSSESRSVTRAKYP